MGSTTEIIERGNLGSRRKPHPDMLSPREVCERFGIAEQTLANWRSGGKGPKWTKVGAVGRPGGFVYYHAKDVEAYLELAHPVTVVDPAA